MRFISYDQKGQKVRAQGGRFQLSGNENFQMEPYTQEWGLPASRVLQPSPHQPGWSLRILSRCVEEGIELNGQALSSQVLKCYSLNQI